MFGAFRKLRTRPVERRRRLRCEPLEDRRLLSVVPYVVNSLADVVAADGVVTLREALEAANTNTAVGDAHAGSDTETDIITFALPAAENTITLASSQLDITDDVSIEGPGAALLTIEAPGSGVIRVLNIGGCEASLSGLTIRGGSATAGAGIYNTGTLTVTDSIFSENFAGTTGGGGIYNSRGSVTIRNSVFSGNQGDHGAAICNFGGTMTLVDSIITGNRASWGGGGINTSGTVSITNSIISGNRADHSGGGIYVASGTLTIANSTISGNSAEEGGAIYCNTTSSGILTLTNSIVALNRSPKDASIQGAITAQSGFNLIGIDPLFVDFKDDTQIGPGPDTMWGTADDVLADLRPTSYSPAIDMGSNDAVPPGLTVDLHGNPRILGSRVDVGAYEFQDSTPSGRETASTLVTTLENAVDLYDGVISLREALLYASQEELGNAILFDAPLDTGTIVLNGTPLYVDRALSIDASSRAAMSVSGDGRSGVFVVPTSAEVGLVGLTITGGSAYRGGGILHYSGPMSVVDSTIAGNSATYQGGGICGGNDLTVTNCTISGNSGSSGGGVYAGSHLTISDSSISGNSAHYGGGFAGGGTSNVISNSTVSNNSAEQGGGIRTFSQLTVINSTVSGNSANVGGGIENWLGTLVVINSTISDNSAGEGGGIDNYGTATVIGSNITGNSVSHYGAGIYNCRDNVLAVIDSLIVGNSTSRDGGAIYNYSGGIATVTNSTLAGNVAKNYGGGTYTRDDGTLTVANCIVVLNTAPYGPNTLGPMASGSGFNLIGGDPLFVRNPSSGADGTWGTEDDDYGDLRLTAASTAINAGSNALLPADGQDLDGDGDTSEPLPIDLAGRPRVIYEIVDIGAYEYWLAGDVNTDRFVGADDLDIVRARWGQSVAPGDWLHGDVSGDGYVGADDLDIVRANWGQSVLPPPVVTAVTATVKKVAKAQKAKAHDVVMEQRAAQAGRWDARAALSEVAWAYQREQVRAREGVGAASGRTEKARDAVLSAYWGV